jgi:hypothetical protein
MLVMNELKIFSEKGLLSKTHALWDLYIFLKKNQRLDCQIEVAKLEITSRQIMSRFYFYFKR